MFPLAVRWQVIRNRQKGRSWASIVDHCGCSLAAAQEWWSNFEHHGSPWRDPVLENRHADAARFRPEFLRALEGLVRLHPEMFLHEMKTIFVRLLELPGFDASWPCSVSTLSRMLNAIGFSVKKVERLASERCEARIVQHCRRYREAPDRCVVVADETHIAGPAMVRPRGWAPVGRKLEILAPDPRARARYSSTVAISHNRGILELAVHEVPPAQNGDDWFAFCTSLAGRMNAFVPGADWAGQPDDCILLYDNAAVHTQAADNVLAINGVRRMRLPPYSPDLSAIEPTFADYKRQARDITFRHPDLPDRMVHVLAFASIPLSSIQGHFREARRQTLRHIPELNAPGGPLFGIFPPLPVVRSYPQL